MVELGLSLNVLSFKRDTPWHTIEHSQLMTFGPHFTFFFVWPRSLPVRKRKGLPLVTSLFFLGVDLPSKEVINSQEEKKNPWSGTHFLTFETKERKLCPPSHAFETQDIKTQPQFNHYLRNDLGPESYFLSYRRWHRTTLASFFYFWAKVNCVTPPYGRKVIRG